MHFGQDAGHAQHGHTAFLGLVPRHLEKRGLADPGLAADDECPAALIDPVDQTINQGNVLLSTMQHDG